MPFNSLTFFVFLVIVFALYWRAKSVRGQNVVLLVSSYVFYGWWDWRFCLLLASVTVVSYWSCLKLKHTKRWLWCNVLVFAAVLGVFKYFNFFVDSATTFLTAMGFDAHHEFLRVALPVGISFYTFQVIGYIVDVYRGTIQPERSLLVYSVAISFFPKIATGPIEKSVNILPQCEKRRMFDYEQSMDGCRQMLCGLFKKMVIADQCGKLATRVFLGYESMSGSMRLVGAILYAFQIYGDFSGYSDMAIGTAKLFGINLAQNFSYPYFARNVAEFWRRWHMSLMAWFKDYLYIPLGGNRCGKLKQLRNTFVVFLVSGLWHGANWTFVVWGLVHACLFLPILLIKWSKRDVKLPTPLAISLTFISVTLAWVFFRSPDIGTACSYLSGVFSRSLFSKPTMYLSMFPWLAAFCAVEWLQRNKSHALDIRFLPKPLRFMICLTVLIVCISYNERSAEFIYFQF